MEYQGDERELEAAGTKPLGGGRTGFVIRGWEVESRKRPILSSSMLQQWEEKLQASHFPEMIFGESCFILKHLSSGINLNFNAYDALCGWKKEALPPVEVPAAAMWKFKSKPTDQVVLDYDYTFTTPYSGSACFEENIKSGRQNNGESFSNCCWEDCSEQIDMVALAAKEPILFYDEVILYEDELADNGVSLLTVKVRVMPTGWFLLLRFWLRVDGVLVRLRDTRMHCAFSNGVKPVVLREICWREATFKFLASKGFPTDSAAYSDPSVVSEALPIMSRKTQKLIIV